MEIFKDPVPLSEGVKLKDLISGSAEFHVDMDFKKEKMSFMMNCDEDLCPDMGDSDDSDSGNAYNNMEASAMNETLACPEYHSFSDLASKMIDLVPSGDVKIHIIEEGVGHLVPVDAIVNIHYSAYFEKAQMPFDCSLTMNAGSPLRIRLGKGRFLPGLEIGLTSVKGPKARFLLLVQPKFAWGPLGVPPRVRPEPALFVVVLNDVDDTQAPMSFNNLPSEEQKKIETVIRTVKSINSHAKLLFSKAKYIKAVKNYQQSLSILNLAVPKNDSEESDLRKLKVKAYTNLAVCYCKLNKPKHVLGMCEALEYVVDIENNCKILFYIAKGNEMLGRNEEAVKYYKKALKLEPKNKDIGSALANLDKYNKLSANKERDFCQKAFECSSLEKKPVVYDVDDSFRSDINDMCQTLAGRDEYAKFELPPNLTKNEIGCIKDVISKFDSLALLEDEKGKKKKFSVVRKSD